MSTELSSEVINGIDVGALRQAIATIEADPDAGQTRWVVKSGWKGGTRTDHSVDGFSIGGERVERRFEIQVDEPSELCGSNQFANPQEYLLAATNACMMVGYAAAAALMGIRLTRLEVEMSGDIDLRGFLDIDESVANGYESLHYVVHLDGDASPEDLRQLHEFVQRTSPNYYNITHAVKLTSELVLGPDG